MTKNQLKEIVRKCLSEMEYDPRDEPDSGWNPSGNITYGIQGKTKEGKEVAKILNDFIIQHVKNPQQSSMAMGDGQAIVKIIDEENK